MIFINLQRIKEIIIYIAFGIVLLGILVGTIWFEYSTRYGNYDKLEKRIEALEKIHNIKHK